jgi:hypothetical protein
MAVQASILSMSVEAGNSGTLANTTASAAIPVGLFRVIAINATQDMNIRFGNGSVQAAATDFRIPANATFVFNTGQDTQDFSLYNNSGASLTYFWAYLQKN